MVILAWIWLAKIDSDDTKIILLSFRLTMLFFVKSLSIIDRLPMNSSWICLYQGRTKWERGDNKMISWTGLKVPKFDTQKSDWVLEWETERQLQYLPIYFWCYYISASLMTYLPQSTLVRFWFAHSVQHITRLLTIKYRNNFNCFQFHI
jgi:hypothetical protein